MGIYKRGDVYWFKFVFDGRLIRQTTKQGNDKIARQLESAERVRLAKERNERKAAIEKLKCEQVSRCPECELFFDAATTIRDTLSRQQFCSNHCRDTWIRKHRAIPTLADFCENRVRPFAKSTHERTVPKTYKWYEFGINALKQAGISKLRLDEIGTEQIAEFTSELQLREKARGKKKNSLQLSTINSCLRALRRVLHLAAEWHVIEVVPKVKMLSGERHRERVLTGKEEAKYLAAAHALLHDVSLVLFDTGVRPEECHNMRWENINWVGGRYGTLFIPSGKGPAARRFLPLSQRARLALQKRWKDAGQPAEGWVWPAENKEEHINHDSLKLQHKNAVKLSKVRAFEVYSIRHTFLTRLGESGCDVWTLARIAGHSNIKMSQRYVHPSEDSVRKAFSRLGRHNSGHNQELALGEGETDTHESSTNSEG